MQAEDDIPGVYRITPSSSVVTMPFPKLSPGGDVLYKSGVYVRGDESNQLGKLDGYTTVNVRGEYKVNKAPTGAYIYCPALREAMNESSFQRSR